MSQFAEQAETLVERLVRYYLSAALMLVIGATVTAPVALLVLATR